MVIHAGEKKWWYAEMRDVEAYTTQAGTIAQIVGVPEPGQVFENLEYYTQYEHVEDVSTGLTKDAEPDDAPASIRGGNGMKMDMDFTIPEDDFFKEFCNEEGKRGHDIQFVSAEDFNEIVTSYCGVFQMHVIRESDGPFQATAIELVISEEYRDFGMFYHPNCSLSCHLPHLTFML